MRTLQYSPAFPPGNPIGLRCGGGQGVGWCSLLSSLPVDTRSSSAPTVMLCFPWMPNIAQYRGCHCVRGKGTDTMRLTGSLVHPYQGSLANWKKNNKKHSVCSFCGRTASEAAAAATTRWVKGTLSVRFPPRCLGKTDSVFCFLRRVFRRVRATAGTAGRATAHRDVVDGLLSVRTLSRFQRATDFFFFFSEASTSQSASVKLCAIQVEGALCLVYWSFESSGSKMMIFFFFVCVWKEGQNNMLLIIHRIFRGKSHWKGFCCSVTTHCFFFFFFFCRTLERCERGNVPTMCLTAPYFQTKTPMGVQMGATILTTCSLWAERVNFTSQSTGMLLFVLLSGQRGWVTVEIPQLFFGRTHVLNHTEPLSLASFALMHVIAANSKRFFKSRLHTQSLRLPAREERKRIKMEKYRGDR